MYADSFIRAPRLTLPENLGIDEISSSMAKYGGTAKPFESNTIKIF